MQEITIELIRQINESKNYPESVKQLLRDFLQFEQKQIQYESSKVKYKEELVKILKEVVELNNENN